MLKAWPAVTLGGAVTVKCVAGPGGVVGEKVAVVKPAAPAVIIYGTPAREFAVKSAAATPGRQFICSASAALCALALTPRVVKFNRPKPAIKPRVSRMIWARRVMTVISPAS